MEGLKGVVKEENYHRGEGTQKKIVDCLLIFRHRSLGFLCAINLKFIKKEGLQKKQARNIKLLCRDMLQV